MTFHDMCKYILDERSKVEDAWLALENKVAKAEQDFLYLAQKLFSKKTTILFSHLIPSYFHPSEVYGRAHEHKGLSGYIEFEEATNVYNSVISKLYSPN